jgi:hypothetical protein
MAVGVFRPVLVSLPGIVAVAVLVTRAIVLADWAVPVAGVTGITCIWARPVPCFRRPAVTVRSTPVRFVCLRAVPFVPFGTRGRPGPVALSRPAPVALSRPVPVALSWPVPVVAYWPGPGLGLVGPRAVRIAGIPATCIRRFQIRSAGVRGRPWPGTCPTARLCWPCAGRPRPCAGRPRPCAGRPRPNSGRLRAGARHPGPPPGHSRWNSPACRELGPVCVGRLPRAARTAQVSGSAARVSSRTRSPSRPGRGAGIRVARVVTPTGCPLRAGGPGWDSRRRSRPRFRPFRVRPVRIRPHLAQRHSVACGAPVAPGAPVTLASAVARGAPVAPGAAVTLRDARAHPPSLMILVQPGTGPLLAAFPAPVAGRGLVVFVLGLMARIPVPVVRGMAIYPVPITVGCGVTTFHRAPPGHSDSDAPADCGNSS